MNGNDTPIGTKEDTLKRKHRDIPSLCDDPDVPPVKRVAPVDNDKRVKFATNLNEVYVLPARDPQVQEAEHLRSTE